MKSEIRNLAFMLHQDLNKLLANDLKPGEKKPAPKEKPNVKPEVKGDIYKDANGKTIKVEVKENSIVINGISYSKVETAADRLRKFRQDYLKGF